MQASEDIIGRCRNHKRRVFESVDNVIWFTLLAALVASYSNIIHYTYSCMVRVACRQAEYGSDDPVRNFVRCLFLYNMQCGKPRVWQLKCFSTLVCILMMYVVSEHWTALFRIQGHVVQGQVKSFDNTRFTGEMDFLVECERDAVLHDRRHRVFEQHREYDAIPWCRQRFDDVAEILFQRRNNQIPLNIKQCVQNDEIRFPNTSTEIKCIQFAGCRNFQRQLEK